MGIALVQFVVALGMCAGAACGVVIVLEVGDRPYHPPGDALVRGRRIEARCLASLLTATAVGTVIAVLDSWPAG